LPGPRSRAEEIEEEERRKKNPKHNNGLRGVDNFLGRGGMGKIIFYIGISPEDWI